MTALSVQMDAARPRLRIAIPAWRLGARQDVAEDQPKAPCFDDFKTLLDAALRPADLTELRLTRSERRQMAMARRLREALYDAPRCA